MTGPEFTKWYNDYCAAFPGTSEWLAKNSPDVPATLRRWQFCLQDSPLALCVRVTDLMATGTLPPVQAYERDQTALHVRACASKLAGIQASEAEVERRRQEQRQAASGYKQGWTMGGVYRRILEVLKAHPEKSVDEVCAIVWPEYGEQPSHP